MDLARRIRASKFESTEELESSFESDVEGSSQLVDGENSLSSGEDSETSGDDEDNTSKGSRHAAPQSPPPASHDALSTISFGALASAQDSLGTNRKKRKASSSQRRSRSPSPFHEASERLAGKKTSHPSRTSKHAPTELSSKKAVGRKRSVIAVPVSVPRDPRFSALSGPLDSHRVEQNYSFLNEYRQSELASLKTQLRKTEDPRGKEELKRNLRAMEDQERARRRAEELREAARDHKKKEQQAVKQGKKPFFLKSAEVKKLALQKRFEAMGEKKVERVMARRRKKKAGKEKREMPVARRGFQDRGD